MADKLNWNILLIDDDEEEFILTRMLLARIENKKCHLDWAASYNAGQQALLARSYDTVLMDYRLGLDDGLDLVREAASRQYPAPIIVLTGHDSYDIDLKAMQAGATQYLSKSDITPALLERSIRHAIEQKQYEKALQSARDELELRVQARTLELAEANQVLEARVAERTQQLLQANEQLDAELRERRKAEKALVDSAAWLDLAQQAGQVGFFDWDLATNRLDRTRQMEIISGVAAGQGSVETARRLIHPDDLQQADAHLAECIQAQRHELVSDYRIIRPDGQVCWIESRIYISYSPAGEAQRIIGAMVDITERKQAEEALRASEARERARAAELDALMDAVPAIVYVTHDPNGQVVLGNRAAYELLQLPPSENLSLNVPGAAVSNKLRIIENGVELPAQHLALQRAAASGKPARDIEAELLFDDGHLSYLLGNASPLLDEAGGPAGAIAAFVNITERKLAEQQVRASLAEKEVLLREVYHRVKNNLMVMIALIELQAERVADPQAREAFQELKRRAHSMSLVHEKLYQSSNLARIRFGDYLKSLVSSLTVSMGNSPYLQVSVEAEEISLRLEDAVPCGLIVNELVTNALKYAFPGGQPCREQGENGCQVTVGLQADGDTLLLSVRDNGIGLPPGLDWRRSETLGLQLVNLLAVQIGGELEVQPPPGASFQIRFPARNGVTGSASAG